MKIKDKMVGDIVVVQPHGKLLGGPDNSPKFHALIKSRISEGGKYFVFNLKKTSWANSMGIGMLIGAYTSAKNVGGAVVLAHVGDRINDILTLTQLLLLFKDFDTEEEAVAFLQAKADAEKGGATASG
jgi:anti-sigma B factor antagonist